MTTEQLPIVGFRPQIVDALANNSVVIVTADTGAGKSTQVPQYLLAEGYNLVVTQPRRLAARTVAARVAFELGEKLGQTVGVRTRDDRVESPATRCLFATDGLALVRELMGVGTHNMLVLDEVHEWNTNIEVLIAWAKLQLSRGANFKVVLMSATLEAEKLAAYFDGAPIINVPGRLFSVEEQRPGRSLAFDVADLLRKGRNVLVFQPGKAEITQTVNDLLATHVNAEILPLHGELTPEEQNACFQRYGRPKCVVATNVAQTSITIDDIDAVVDSGMERRVELSNGVEGLYLRPISLADAKQRKGRAGRTKPGIYIDHCPEADRLPFPEAEIMRTRLDQTVLRLAEAGINAEELAFFHQPDGKEIHEARRALKALGCITPDGKVTRKGHQVAKMPVSVNAACMVIEADRLGVVDDVVTIAAILEVGGDITARVCPTHQEMRLKSCPCWRKHCPDEQQSDILAQLAVFKAARNIKKDQLRANSIHAKAYFKAVDVRRHLRDALRGKVHEFRSSGKQEDILRAVCAGMVNHLYRNDFGRFRNGDDVERSLNRDSVVTSARWVIGIPWDLEVPTRYGRTTLYLIRAATKVDLAWLVDVAPHLMEKKTGIDPRYDALTDMCMSTMRIQFNGQVVSEERVKDSNHPDAAALFAHWLAGQML